MAPFNKRQIGYIQAVAGRQQHVTLISGQRDTLMKSNDTSYYSPHTVPQAIRKAIGCGLNSTDEDAKSLLVRNWTLDVTPSGHDSRPAHNNAKLEAADLTANGTEVGMCQHVNLPCFTAGVVTSNYSSVHNDAEVNSVSTGVPNPELVTSYQRATNDGYLKSTDVRFRFTLPQKTAGSGDVSSLFPTAADLGITNTNANNGITVDQYNNWTKGLESTERSTAIQSLLNQYNLKHPMGQDHYEFRWIVFRNKLPTVPWTATSYSNSTNLEAVRDGASFRNPGYDLFMGQTGRKRGFIGYALNPKLDKEKMLDDSAAECYSGSYWTGSAWYSSDGSDGQLTASQPVGEDKFTVDDLMSARLNRDDYVVMKDVRFFLGKEHGKSHFEDTLHWDWNDPIDTPESNVLSSTTLNRKNFRWQMMLIGTTGGKSPVFVNEHVRWTTKMESG